MSSITTQELAHQELAHQQRSEEFTQAIFTRSIQAKSFEVAAQKITELKVNQPLGNGSFPLHMAIAHQAPGQVVKALLDKGANPWLKDDLDLTAVDLALKNAPLLAYELIGCQEPVKTLTEKECQTTKEKREEARALLLKAEQSLEITETHVAMGIATASNGNLSTQDSLGMTPLFYVIKAYRHTPENILPQLEILFFCYLDHLKDPRIVNKAQFSLLHFAVNEDLPEHLIDKLLQRAGDYKDELMSKPTVGGLSVLHIALLKKRDALFRFLVKQAPKSLMNQKAENGLSVAQLYALRISEEKALIRTKENALMRKEVWLCLLSSLPYVVYATAYVAGYEVSHLPFQLLNVALRITEHWQQPEVGAAVLQSIIELAPLGMVHPSLAALQNYLQPMIRMRRVINCIAQQTRGLVTASRSYKYEPGKSLKAFSVRVMNLSFSCLRLWRPLPTF